MKGLPCLTTPRLVLRPAGEADRDPLWRLLTDPQVRRYLCDDRVLTGAEVSEMLAHSLAQGAAGMGFWMLCDGQDRRIGCVGLHPVTPGILAHAPELAGEIELTIALAPARWGQGYAAEALAAAIAYGFERLALEDLVAVVDAPNARSRRLMLRMGLTPVRTTATGPCHPLRIYRLARSAFAAWRAARSGDL